jgi:polyisoprenoid-binding protein YceI
MKKNFSQVLVCMVFAMMASCSFLSAQKTYKINDSKDIDMKLSGTSTLHKWAMDAKTFSGEAQFGFMKGDNNQLASVKSLNFSLEVQNLKSGEKGLDKNAYKALKTSKYKDIFYELLSATVTPENDNKYLVKTNGSLTVAGVTKEVSIDVFCVVNKDRSITCSGSKQLKMTDYQVKPPTFLLGAMKTGDAITLDFVLVYKK